MSNRTYTKQVCLISLSQMQFTYCNLGGNHFRVFLISNVLFNSRSSAYNHVNMLTRATKSSTGMVVHKERSFYDFRLSFNSHFLGPDISVL